MYRTVDTGGDLVGILRSVIISFTTVALDFFMPITNFLYVIAILATGNIVAGFLADDDGWNFKKAFKAVLYLIGYMTLLLLSFAVGILMKQDLNSVTDFTSWLTWVMIYFYVTNILRNWHIRQSDNKVIAFLYWVATVKFIEKVNYLSEFKKEKIKTKTETNGEY